MFQNVNFIVHKSAIQIRNASVQKIIADYITLRILNLSLETLKRFHPSSKLKNPSVKPHNPINLEPHNLKNPLFKQ